MHKADDIWDQKSELDSEDSSVDDLPLEPDADLSEPSLRAQAEQPPPPVVPVVPSAVAGLGPAADEDNAT
eukprot:1561133-Rhodomonas_salina.1